MTARPEGQHRACRTHQIYNSIHTRPSNPIPSLMQDDPPLHDLKDIIARVKPHALIGLAGAGHVWNKVLPFLGCLDLILPVLLKNRHVS